MDQRTDFLALAAAAAAPVHALFLNLPTGLCIKVCQLGRRGEERDGQGVEDRILVGREGGAALAGCAARWRSRWYMSGDDFAHAASSPAAPCPNSLLSPPTSLMLSPRRLALCVAVCHVCVQRASGRVTHEGGVEGKGAPRVVNMMSGQLSKAGAPGNCCSAAVCTAGPDSYDVWHRQRLGCLFSLHVVICWLAELGFAVPTRPQGRPPVMSQHTDEMQAACRSTMHRLSCDTAAMRRPHHTSRGLQQRDISNQ